MALKEEALPLAHQENLLSLLAHSDDHGRLIFRSASPDLFEGDYREIAQRCFTFWQQQGQAPKAHTADLFVDILEDEKNRKAPLYRRILTQMYQLSEDEGINAKYIMQQLTHRLRLTQMKSAIHRAAEIVNDPRETSVDEAEKVMNDILAARTYGFQPGMRLTDTKRMTDFLAQQTTEFATGISVLDAARIVPARQKMMAFIAPSGLGKSWFLAGVGKHNLLRRKRVIHYSGELDEEDLAQRYWQALFAAADEDDDEDIKIPVLKRNNDGGLDDIRFETVRPEFYFDSEDIDVELGTRINVHGEGFLNNLIVKRFPNSWEPNDLRAHLDQLEATEGWIPDLIMVDSPYHYKTPTRDPRHTLRRHVEDTREIGHERNSAIIVTHQTNRPGMSASRARGTHLAEDISIFWTADNLLTYSSTDFEHDLGLGRIWVEKSRKKRDKWEALITQNYAMGQFCLSSMRMQKAYYDIRKELQGEFSDEEMAEEGSERNQRSRQQTLTGSDDEYD